MNNVIYDINYKAMTNNNTKAFLCDAPTSSGKTHTQMLLIARLYIDYLNKKRIPFQKVIFIANLKTQFVGYGVREEVIKAYHNGEIYIPPLTEQGLRTQMDRDFIAIESIADDINEVALKTYYSHLKSEFKTNSTAQTICENIEKYKSAKREFIAYKKLILENPKLKNKKYEEMIKTEYKDAEREIRKSTKKLLHSKNIEEEKTEMISEFVKKIWKQSNLCDKFFVEMHIKKSMYPIDTIFSREFNFMQDNPDKSFLKNSLLLLDEPDALFKKMHATNIEEMQKTAIKLKDFLLTVNLALNNFDIYRGNTVIQKIFHKEIKTLLNDYNKFNNRYYNIAADYRVSFTKGHNKNIMILSKKEVKKELYVKVTNVNGKTLVDIVDVKPEGEFIYFHEWQNAVLKLVDQTLSLIRNISKYIYENKDSGSIMLRSDCCQKTMAELGFDDTKNKNIITAIKETVMTNDFCHQLNESAELNIICIDNNNATTETLSSRPFEISVFIKQFDETDQLITMINAAKKTLMFSATGTIKTFAGNFNVRKLRSHFGSAFSVMSDSKENVTMVCNYMNSWRKNNDAEYHVCQTSDNYDMYKYIVDHFCNDRQKQGFKDFFEQANGISHYGKGNAKAWRFIGDFLKENNKSENNEYYHSVFKSLLNNIGCAIYCQLVINQMPGANIIVYTPMNIKLDEHLKTEIKNSINFIRPKLMKNPRECYNINTQIETINAEAMNQSGLNEEDDVVIQTSYDKTMRKMCDNITNSVKNDDKFCNILFMSYNTGDTGINPKFSYLDQPTVNKLLSTGKYNVINDLKKMELNFDTIIAAKRTFMTGIDRTNMKLADKLVTLEYLNHLINEELLSDSEMEKINEYLNNGNISSIAKMFETEDFSSKLQLREMPFRNLVVSQNVQLFGRRQRGNIDPAHILFIIPANIDFDYLFSVHTGLNPEFFCPDIKAIREQVLYSNTKSFDTDSQNSYWAFLTNGSMKQILNNYRSDAIDEKAEHYRLLQRSSKIILQNLVTNDYHKTMLNISPNYTLPNIFIENKGKNNYWYKKLKNGNFKISYEKPSGTNWSSFVEFVNKNQIPLKKMGISYDMDYNYKYIIGPWFIDFLDGEIAETFFGQMHPHFSFGGSCSYHYTTNKDCTNKDMFETFDFLAESIDESKIFAFDIKNSESKTNEEFKNILTERNNTKEICKKVAKIQKTVGLDITYYILNMHPHENIDSGCNYKHLTDSNGKRLENIVVVNNCVDENGNNTPELDNIIRQITK